MSLQRVSMSFLDSYEKDSNALNEMCRTCLCKTDDEYVSIHSVLPWTPREVCTAQQIIQQILNREVIKIDSFIIQWTNLMSFNIVSVE